MKYLLVLFALIFTALSNANSAFTPLIIEGKDAPVCKLALKHYQDIYNSPSMSTRGISTTQDFYVPEFSSESSDQNTIQTANIRIDNSDKVIVYFTRWLGYSEVSAGYMIEPTDSLPDQINQLKETHQIKNVSSFYPADKGSSVSWQLNMPFRYLDQWYVLEDYDDFQSHNAIRNLYQIHADSTSSKACSIQIYPKDESKKIIKNFTFFAAYLNSAEEILVAPSSCGDLRPEVYAADNGRNFVSTALIRPWAAIAKMNQNSSADSALRNQQESHFNHWKYTDPWTYRESESLDYLTDDAENELKNYYMSQFGYTNEKAQGTAHQIIHEIPFSYYSLGVYEDSKKDFTPLQQMANGQFDNWKSIDLIMKLKYGKIGDIVFSLMLDNPQQFSGNPSLKIDQIENYYKKNFLMYAAHMNNFDTVEWLVKNKFPLNRTTFTEYSMCYHYPERINRSALTYAAENGSIHLIKLLIDAGEKTDIVDNKGNKLDFYLQNNPRFTDEEKALGIEKLAEKYAGTGVQPSFNCNQKLGTIESTICNSKGLSIYDQELSAIYKKVFHKSKTIEAPLKKSQLTWLKQRSNQCMQSKNPGAIAGCIARVTRSRIHYLEYVDRNISSPAP